MTVDPRNKKKDIIKERNSKKKNSQKIGTEKNLTKKEMYILIKKEGHGN